MKTIWQKIDRRIARLRIFRNSATIIKNTVTTDITSGATSATSLTLDIPCREPEKVREHLVDQTLVYAGDLSVTLDYLTLKKLARSTSPALAWSENTGILNPETDEIQFAGITYAIRSIIPQDWKNNRPGQYVVVLKGIAPEESSQNMEEMEDEVQT